MFEGGEVGEIGSGHQTARFSVRQQRQLPSSSYFFGFIVVG